MPQCTCFQQLALVPDVERDVGRVGLRVAGAPTVLVHVERAAAALGAATVPRRAIAVEEAAERSTRTRNARTPPTPLEFFRGGSQVD